MRYWAMVGILTLALVAPALAQENAPPLAGTSEATPPAPIATGKPHPLFAPSPEEIEAAARLGERARKAGKTVEQLLELWSVPVPGAPGKVLLMVPAARVAAAAYEATRLHKSDAQKKAAIEEALAKDKDLVLFQVTLQSKGTGSWLWPYDAKPGDKKALESIAFVLYNGRGRYYQPIDPNADRRVKGQEKTVGSPVPVTVYGHVESFWFSLPVLGSSRRTDFVAKYEVAFLLNDSKSAEAIVVPEARSLGLRIIGARGEKEARFSLTALQDLLRKPPR